MLKKSSEVHLFEEHPQHSNVTYEPLDTESEKNESFNYNFDLQLKTSLYPREIEASSITQECLPALLFTKSFLEALECPKKSTSDLNKASAHLSGEHTNDKQQKHPDETQLSK